MFSGDENWCKILFISMLSSNLVAIATSYFFNSSHPYLNKVVRYGKLLDVTQSRPLRFMELPKSYFKHFYVLATVIYIPVILYQLLGAYLLKREVSGWFMKFLDLCCGSRRSVMASKAATCLALTLMTLQIWRRFYETQFISVFSKNATINIFQYGLGLVFYMFAILIILSAAPTFAELDEKNIFHSNTLTWIDAVAVIVFLWAWYHQHITTVILANLRKNKKGDVVSEKYEIPHGDWFETLSSPHCTAEIIMYTSIWIILGIKHSWWQVYLTVLFNQVDSIINSHQWYHSHFKNFPRKRKCILPYII